MAALRESTVACPVCGTDIPVAYKVARQPSSLPRRTAEFRFIFTDQSWVDLRAHLWTHDPEMD